MRMLRWMCRVTWKNKHMAGTEGENVSIEDKSGPMGLGAQDYKHFLNTSRCSTHNLCSEMT